MFGVNCSSSLLNAALQYHLGSEGLARAGFRVRKWLSNSKGLLNRIEQIIEGRARKRDVLDHETYAKVSMQVSNNSDKSEKVLGMSWNCESDKFIFSLEKLAQKAKSVVTTRRNTRNMIAGFFDPLDIISLIAMSIELLFQELSDKVEWDEELIINKYYFVTELTVAIM